MAAERPVVRHRLGFSLAEVVAAVAILAILGAVVVRNAAGASDRKRVQDSIVTLKHLTHSIARFDSVVSRYPRRITHLHTKITGSPETSICATVTYTGRQQRAWETNWRGGPFFEYPTPASGFPIPIGMVSDTLVRNPLTASNTARSFGLLQIVVRQVTDGDAAEINLLVDMDNDNSTGGAIRWTADGSGTNTMTWNIPIAGC